MSVQILIGDCRDKLRELPDASVHCCVTSPPYFGLRDYGVAGQMGLEPTPDEFVAGMIEVFREVRRVLRDDGTLWLNIGDSYAGSGRGGGSEGSKQQTNTGSLVIPSNRGSTLAAGLHEGVREAGGIGRAWVKPPKGLKQKDLIGIPWMLAFALRADGWYLRQEIIWHKPNPMPESVRDRCTKAHEQIFLLSKSPRYHFDAEAISEEGCGAVDMARRHGSSETVQAKGIGGYRVGGTETRNKRSVWTVTTQPFSEAHFATFPPALIEPCILAGCPDECCPKCGTAWDSDCGCKQGGIIDTVPGTVLDPFGGAGTTGLVADRLGRNATLIELNPEYAEIARNRLSGDGGMFADVQVAA